jgi:hypothetical protein
MAPRLSLLALGLSGIVFGIVDISAAQPERSDRPLGILLAAGDIARCGRNPYNQQATADLIGREIVAANAAGTPIRVLALGDLAYDSGAVREFRCFHRSWGKYMDYLLPVPGNHEYVAYKDAAPYFAYFRKYDKKIVSAHGSRAGYYSLNFPESGSAQWHLVALNSAENGPGRAQRAWLEKDLATDDRRCVLGFAHYFRFSSGRHGHEPPDHWSNGEDLKKDFVPDEKMKESFRMLHAVGASLLVSGHDHHYEVFAPQDAEGNAVSNGVRSFIVGTGGGPFYDEKYEKPQPNSDQTRYQAKWHGVLKLELFAAHYNWRFVPASNDPMVPPELTAPVTNECNMRVETKKR